MFHLLPYPPDDGGRIGFFNPIKYLSRKHEVSVVCLKDANDQETSVAELRKYCVGLRTYERAKWSDPYRLLRGVAFSPPGSAAKYWDPAVGGLIAEMIRRHKSEIVEFHHLNTAAYRKFAGRLPTVLREHNVEYKVWQRYAENASGWMARSYGKWTAPRVRKYEAAAASRFDRCVVVSHADADHLRAVSPMARIEMIPSGVDTEYFHPVATAQEEPWSITLTGSFEWKPKQQSLLRLLTEVFPRIKARVPEAKLRVVGKGVPEHLKRLGRETEGVTITGQVADVRPYIARSALLINYLESGGGIALKVLEAMAMRKPVLSNSLGCEGISVKHDRDIFLADGAESFAEAAAYLLRDQSARSGLAEEGFRRVHESYSWNVVVGRLGDCYDDLVKERERMGRVADTVREEYAC